MSIQVQTNEKRSSHTTVMRLPWQRTTQPSCCRNINGRGSSGCLLCPRPQSPPTGYAQPPGSSRDARHGQLLQDLALSRPVFSWKVCAVVRDSSYPGPLPLLLLFTLSWVSDPHVARMLPIVLGPHAVNVLHVQPCLGVRI